jgi:hypothetical protein
MQQIKILRKRSFIWSLFLCAISLSVSAQQFEWAKSIGGLGQDAAREVATDLDGNVIVVGSISGSASFGNVAVAGFGVKEAFVAKYNTGGDLLWVRLISGPLEDMARGVVVDQDNDIFVVGHFTDTVFFKIEGLDTISAGSAGGQDVFVVKYDADGNYLWHLTCGGPEDDTATDIDHYRWADKLYVSGGFQGRARFGATASLSNGDTDAFLMKIDGDGNVHWVRHGGGDVHDVAAAVAVDKTNGSIYVAGDFYQNAEFEGNELEAIGSSDVFLARYDEDGNLLWIQSHGGTNVDVATNIDTDLNNYVYVSGYYQLTTEFQDYSVTALGYNDVFLAKFNPEGDCQWLSSAGSNALDNCLGMDVAGDGTAYLTGMFENEMFADGLSFEGDDYDVFILCYNSDGNVRYGRSAGGSNADFGMAACLGPDQSLYVSGYYFFFGTFDDSTIGIAENGDAFIAKLTDIVSVDEMNRAGNCITGLGGGQFRVACATNGSWGIYDMRGALVANGQFNNATIKLPHLPRQVYLLKAESADGFWALPFVSQ